MLRGQSLKIAYLVNRYPAVSHSFIRREIAAIEETGVTVLRFSVRAAIRNELPDSRDQAEFDRTEVLLDASKIKLVVGLIKRVVLKPVQFIRAARIAFSGAGMSPAEGIRRVAYLAEASLLAERLNVENVEHLHAHFGTNPAMVARLVKMLGGPPYSFTVHGPDEFDRPVELDLAGKIADAAFCVGISSFGASQLMRWSNPANWPRIHVVRCGVDEGFIDAQDDIPIPPEPRLSCVARLSAQKGLPLLIDAAAMLKNQGREFHLTLIGDGEMRADIETKIGRYGLQKHITITGWASSYEVQRHITASRVMVLPSFAEGLPVVIMEALALNRPVIASAIAGTPELVDAACGWLIPAGSVDALASAMTEALDAPVTKLQAMGAEGRSRVLAHHDSRKNGRQLLELIVDYQRKGQRNGMPTIAA